MRCQRCNKPATYHITDLEKPGRYQEYHFCDEHALQHLTPSASASEGGVPDLVKGLVDGGKGSTVQSSPVDRLTCPQCQLTFLEFRNTGRMGCPHDYEVFRDEIVPLLENIHNATRHSGKVPRRAPKSSETRSLLNQRRGELKTAIASEDYEQAARLRDEIRLLEQELES
jgi:protein arginine kinase activator